MIKSIFSFAAAMIAAGVVALPQLPPQVRARGPELCAGGRPEALQRSALTVGFSPLRDKNASATRTRR